MKIGTEVKMTADAVDNYGEKWSGVTLVVTHEATKYMPAKEFYDRGMPNGYHPGYDESGGALHDLKREDSGEQLPMSLYSWELVKV